MPFRYRSADECPAISGHMAQPYGYIQWDTWANKMSKTHRQARCPTCGFWSIWVPKEKTAQPTPAVRSDSE